MIRGNGSVLAVLAFLAIVSVIPAVARAERYTSAKYGITAALPANADVCRSPAPQPNQGFLFRPRGVHSPPCDDDIESGDRYSEMDARFDVDGTVTITNFVTVECPKMAFDSEGRVTAISPPVRPAGARWTACRIDGANGSVLEILFGQRGSRNGVPAVDYTIVLKTTLRYRAADVTAFERWLTSVRIGPVS